jgi:hypothetical protein
MIEKKQLQKITEPIEIARLFVIVGGVHILDYEQKNKSQHLFSSQVLALSTVKS